MEENRELMVTITLRHYDKLNRDANMNIKLNDKISRLESAVYAMNDKIDNLSGK